jgi:hypothetical protein
VTPGEELILTFDVGRYRVSVWLGVPLQLAAEKEGAPMNGYRLPRPHQIGNTFLMAVFACSVVPPAAEAQTESFQ